MGLGLQTEVRYGEPSPELWCLGCKYAKPTISATLHRLRPEWRVKTAEPVALRDGFPHRAVASATRWQVNLHVSDKWLVIGIVIEGGNAQHACDEPCNK